MTQDANLPRRESGTRSNSLPPHKAQVVPGVHAYPIDHSVAQGDTLELAVSADVPYRLSFCRLGLAVDDPSGDDALAVLPESPASPVPIYPGSYVHVPTGLTGPLRTLTIDCWVRPWTVEIEAGLITQGDRGAIEGVGLYLAPGGKVVLHLGDGLTEWPQRVLTTQPGAIESDRWQHVVGTWDGREASLWIDGTEVVRSDLLGHVDPGGAPLRLAAFGVDGEAAGFLDGDLSSPRILERLVGAAEVGTRFEARGLDGSPRGEGTLAYWPLDEEVGDRVADASGHGRHGTIVNHGTWMIGGPSLEEGLPEYTSYDPAADPRRGHGLRFASDDLYDCRWPIVHRWVVPEDARPGIFVARFDHEVDGEPRRYDCTFIVRRAQGRPRAPIVAIAATNTWRAYSATPFANPTDPCPVWLTQGLAGHHDTDLPAFSLYRPHAAGQASYQVGTRMPWPAAGPYVVYGRVSGYSHLMRAERFALTWLEAQGYDYDMISDVDLHRDPDALAGYRTVLINGHNEYWTLEMCDGFGQYLRGGGTAIVLSGNSISGRVSFNDDGTIIENRKVDRAQFRSVHRRAEGWHSHDGLRGGNFRVFGRPGWLLVGLDIVGVNDKNDPRSLGWWEVDRADHPFFHEPEETGLGPGDRFGWAGAEAVLPMAHVHEVDARPSTMVGLMERPPPEGAEVPSDPPGMTLLANGVIRWSEGGSSARIFDYFRRSVSRDGTTQGGEMIYWERPEGGRVFNAGTIGAGWTLPVDDRWAALLRNVLAHFGVSGP